MSDDQHDLIAHLYAEVLARLEDAHALASEVPASRDPMHDGGVRSKRLSEMVRDVAALVDAAAIIQRTLTRHAEPQPAPVGPPPPVSAITLAEDVMNGATMREDERANFLRNIGEDAERLRRLVERLHELARAEHAAIVVETIDLSEALAAICESHATASLHLDLAAAPGLRARISRESLEIVAANLIANAVQGGASRLAIKLPQQPAASPKALTRISREIRGWTLHKRSDKSLTELAEKHNPCIRGWITYYSHFYMTQMRPTLKRIDAYVIRWARRKFKRMRHQTKGARDWFDRFRRANPRLLAHWPLCHGNGRTSGAV